MEANKATISSNNENDLTISKHADNIQPNNYEQFASHNNNNSNEKIISSSSGSHLSSLETNSIADLQADQSVVEVSHITRRLPKDGKIYQKWQILEGLKDGQRFEEKPLKFTGFMLKRRKRPLKGWHKRFFCLENGRLSYAKSASDITKGKTHGSIDVGLSVISTKISSRRIDIDSEYYIFHLKVKRLDDFNQWVQELKNHRLARHHEINYGNSLSHIACDNSSNESDAIEQSVAYDKFSSDLQLSAAKFSEVEICDHLFRLQEKLIKLSSLLKLIEVSANSASVTDLEGFKYKKPRRRFHLRKKKNTTSNKTSCDAVTSNRSAAVAASNSKEDQLSLQSDNFFGLSHPSLTEEECSNLTPITSVEIHDHKLLSKTEAMNTFILLANEVNSTYRELLKTFQDEKQIRLKAGLFRSNSIDEGTHNNNAKRFNMLRNRNSSLDEVDESSNFQHHNTLSRFSQDDTSVLSISEYYDAEDKISPSDYNSSTSEEDDDDESIVTDFSEEGLNFQTIAKTDISASNTGRRTKLPSVQPSSDISLWSLLCKNIGKDLSKISMPVTINEPLNVLQRLCEELEYSELLDMAASVSDATQRMLLMASFAVSAYSSSFYRAGHKPFNPLLGETFECVRKDKNFRFMSEQVNHHPPVSACFAESNNYLFWQDLRVKSKFWGKSMEVIPFGMVNVILKPYNCHYKWNKITTCVHNLFKGERYVDNYGELSITDGDLICKITFEKAGYWSNKKNEISGVIINSKGDVIEKLFGRWNESIHCGTPPTTRCIWRPGTMPENYQNYYGFSRFAIELNELTEKDQLVLPPTDTRFRPDQRLLEEGNIAKAEAVKLELEQSQRDRRRERDEKGLPEYIPLWFRKELVGNEEAFVFNHKYWEAKEIGFSGFEFVHLW